MDQLLHRAIDFVNKLVFPAMLTHPNVGDDNPDSDVNEEDNKTHLNGAELCVNHTFDNLLLTVFH